MKDNRSLVVIILAVLVIFGIAVFFVVGGTKEGPEKIANTEVAEVAPADTAVPQENAQEETEGSVQPTDTSVPVEEIEIVPTVRAGLESTNPADVNLASGNLQLIELFAFW